MRDKARSAGIEPNFEGEEMSLEDNQSDKGDLENRLRTFCWGKEVHMQITRMEAKYLADLVSADWHGRVLKSRF